jgi:hypothetical protein
VESSIRLGACVVRVVIMQRSGSGRLLRPSTTFGSAVEEEGLLWVVCDVHYAIIIRVVLSDAHGRVVGQIKSVGLLVVVL